MRFESLDCMLCLVALVVSWGGQFVLHLLFLDALFEGLQGFIVQCVLFLSPRPANLILLIVSCMPISSLPSTCYA
jgi:hypothetical protein